MIVGGMFVFVSLRLSLGMFTVSNALLMSRATTIVLLGGCFSLKPLMIVPVILWSAVSVECCDLKPCW